VLLAQGASPGTPLDLGPQWVAVPRRFANPFGAKDRPTTSDPCSTPEGPSVDRSPQGRVGEAHGTLEEAGCEFALRAQPVKYSLDHKSEHLSKYVGHERVIFGYDEIHDN